MDPDVDLIRRAQARDDQAFGELFDRHSTAVYRFAYAQTHDALTAQDLVQETFVTAWKKLPDIRLVDESMLPWLIATCRNHVRNLTRKAFFSGDALPLDDAVAHEGSSLEEDRAAHAEEAAWVFEAIERLSDADRRVVLLCLYEGLSYKEASLALGVTVGAVAKRVERSRTRLRQMRDDEQKSGGEA